MHTCSNTYSYKHTLTMKEFGLLHHFSDFSPVNSAPTLVWKREQRRREQEEEKTFYTLQHGCVNIFWVQSTRPHSFLICWFGKNIPCLKTDRQTEGVWERERLYTTIISQSWLEILSSLTWTWCSLQAGLNFVITAINENHWINLCSIW